MKSTARGILVCLAFSAPLSSAQTSPPSTPPATPQADDSRAAAIDDFVRGAMQRRHIPGLSLAIIQDGKIIKAKGYGVAEQGGERPVTASTLFQAGSISKSVAAVGALRLVEAGQARAR